MSEDNGFGKFIGGLIAGAALLCLGASAARPSRLVSRKIRSSRSFRRRRNPGSAWRETEAEIMEYIREARGVMQELRNPKPPPVDAEFISNETMVLRRVRDMARERFASLDELHNPGDTDALIFILRETSEALETANGSDRSQDAPPEATKECRYPFACAESPCPKPHTAKTFGTANEPDRSQDAPPEAMKQPWRVVQDGLGTWNVWETESVAGWAPRSVALSLTEENANQIVSDHNRGLNG
jgi:hypothetical protein